MVFVIGLMTLGTLSMVIAGIYFELNPARSQRVQHYYHATLGTNIALFLAAEAALIFLGLQDAMAEPVATAKLEQGVSLGTALAIIGVGIPTAVSTVSAALAVGPIGAASLAALSEKPEIFGRTLIYLGLAEGIAIYGLVVSILLLGKI